MFTNLTHISKSYNGNLIEIHFFKPQNNTSEYDFTRFVWGKGGRSRKCCTSWQLYFYFVMKFLDWVIGKMIPPLKIWLTALHGPTEKRISGPVPLKCSYPMLEVWVAVPSSIALSPPTGSSQLIPACSALSGYKLLGYPPPGTVAN